jgi:Flp pilus assembly protein TadG
MKSQRNDARRRGTALAETALVLPFLLAVILGGLDFGFQLHVVHRMTAGAREAARTLAVRGGTTVQATTAALNQLAGINATFTVTFPAPVPPYDPCDTIVCVSVPQNQVSLGTFTLLGLSSGGTLRVQAIMRKED